MSDHTQLGEPNLWIPEPDPILRAAMGKLQEEANELAGRISRIMIQGIDGVDPEDNRTNRDHLRDEIADVTALTALVRTMYYPKDVEYIENRVAKKFQYKLAWITKLRKHFALRD